MAGNCNLPQLLRCVEKDCHHTVDLTQELRNRVLDALPAKALECPKCGGRWQVRCGSGPRPKSGRERRCYGLAKLGHRCSKHGGAALKAQAHPNFEHGRDSRYIPSRYADAYLRGMNDPLVQRQMKVQLALLEGVQEEALQRLGTGESGAAWEALRAQGQSIRNRLQQIRAAGSRGESERAGELAKDLLGRLESELLPIVDHGVGEEAARRELIDLFTKRARLIRVQQQGEKTVPVETLSVLQAAFQALLATHIEDRRTLNLIIGGLRDMALPGWATASMGSVPPAQLAASTKGN